LYDQLYFVLFSTKQQRVQKLKIQNSSFGQMKMKHKAESLTLNSSSSSLRGYLRINAKLFCGLCCDANADAMFNVHSRKGTLPQDAVVIFVFIFSDSKGFWCHDE